MSFIRYLSFENAESAIVAPHEQFLRVPSAERQQVGAGMGYTMCIVFLGYGLAFWFGMTLRLGCRNARAYHEKNSTLWIGGGGS